MKSVTHLIRSGDASKEATGHRLKLVRDALGLTQDQMATAMQTGVKNYQHMEAGKTFPRPFHVQSLFDRLKIDHHYVYGGAVDGVPSTVALALRAMLADDAPG